MKEIWQFNLYKTLTSRSIFNSVIPVSRNSSLHPMLAITPFIGVMLGFLSLLKGTLLISLFGAADEIYRANRSKTKLRKKYNIISLSKCMYGGVTAENPRCEWFMIVFTLILSSISLLILLVLIRFIRKLFEDRAKFTFFFFSDLLN